MRSTASEPNAKTPSLQGALAQIRATRIDSFDADLREFQYAGGHCVKVGMDTHELAPDAWRTFCRYFDLPADLLPQLKAHLGGLVLKCVKAADRRGRDAPEEVRLSCGDGGRVLALTPATLASPSNEEAVAVIGEAIPRHILSETLCARLSLTPTAFELDLYTSQRPVEPRPGDIVYGGVSIRHSQAGCSPTVVLGYIHRLVCTNGMTQRVCLAGKPARTKRSSAQSSQPVLDAMREQIKGALDQLESRLEGIQRLTEQRMDVGELPEALRRRWSINRALAAEIAAALGSDELGRTYTEYDLVNALSRVATHNSQLAARYRRHFALAAGMFAQRHVHQCLQCGTWLSSTAQN